MSLLPQKKMAPQTFGTEITEKRIQVMGEEEFAA
jgi:hypothetical protein